MASISSKIKNVCSVLQQGKQTLGYSQTFRPICTSQRLRKEKEEAPEQSEQLNSEEKRSWFQNLLRVRTIAPSKESHSSQLSNKETLFEVMFHKVKPEFMEQYLKQFELYQNLMHEKDTGASLVGSFTVEIGDQDEAIHIWKYQGGYPRLNSATNIYRTDKDFIEFRKARNTMLRARKNQILLNFSFWPDIEPREGSNIYEMRSYTLKAGTMIEWANNWSRALQHRSDSNPVAGLFSQIGEQYQVHHIWCYPDLQVRKETREMAWSKPGWDQCVQYTVPLIRQLDTRIMIPTPFSPLQ